jgi:hypothetical protein
MSKSLQTPLPAEQLLVAHADDWAMAQFILATETQDEAERLGVISKLVIGSDPSADAAVTWRNDSG